MPFIYFYFDGCAVQTLCILILFCDSSVFGLRFGPNDRHSIFISIQSSTDFVILCFIGHLLSSKSICCCLFAVPLFFIQFIRLLTAYNFLLFKLSALNECIGFYFMYFLYSLFPFIHRYTYLLLLHQLSFHFSSTLNVVFL